MVLFPYLSALVLVRINMPPIIEFTNWYKRSSDATERIEPFRKYYFLCEGENTEKWYFEYLINNKKFLGIHPLIDVRYLEKTEEDKHISHPKRLLEFADEVKEDKTTSFDKHHDKIIIVFDLDIFKNKAEDYATLISKIQNLGYIPAVTNPSFELFLLLHVQDSFQQYISIEKTNILANKKVGKQRYIQHLLSSILHINSKKNSKIGELADKIDIAIEQEHFINQNLDSAIEDLSSNIASIIEMIKNDTIE